MPLFRSSRIFCHISPELFICPLGLTVIFTQIIEGTGNKFQTISHTCYAGKVIISAIKDSISTFVGMDAASSHCAANGSVSIIVELGIVALRTACTNLGLYSQSSVVGDHIFKVTSGNVNNCAFANDKLGIGAIRQGNIFSNVSLGAAANKGATIGVCGCC